VIIDCLEFNRSLRILDAASELSFLALECERLAAPEIGKRILNAYSEQADDRPPNMLLEFYRAYHACVRAKIAIWHLNDDAIQDKAAWVAKAEQYPDSLATDNTGASVLFQKSAMNFTNSLSSCALSEMPRRVQTFSPISRLLFRANKREDHWTYSDQVLHARCQGSFLRFWADSHTPEDLLPAPTQLVSRR
jgi:hypothetical protein